jgi:SAM-dependent methyltransferase
MRQLHNKPYTDINAETIDRWVRNGWVWGTPITHEEYVRAQQGEWTVGLTAGKPVPKRWFPPLKGARVLGLASGGGQQMPVFSALGALCTVMDYSAGQLAQERLVAEREGYAISLVKADMTRPFPFPDGVFDMVFHPVSSCYVEKVLPIWQECYRVLQPGGILLAGMDNEMNFLFDHREKGPLTVTNALPFNPLKNKNIDVITIAQEGFQFSHTLEELIGGQLDAGFMLTGLYEDMDTDGLLRTYNIPQYIASRAIKPEKCA